MRVEIVRCDRWGRIPLEAAERITLLRLDCKRSGIFKTWWGEEIGIDTENNRIDLTRMWSIRAAITGRKGVDALCEFCVPEVSSLVRNGCF